MNIIDSKTDSENKRCGFIFQNLVTDKKKTDFGVWVKDDATPPANLISHENDIMIRILYHFHSSLLCIELK